MQWPLQRKKWRGCSPIIIGGCARSGTTLMLSILSSHPAVFAIPFETQALCPTAYYPTPNPNAELQIDVVRDLVLAAELNSEHRFWCEKTPRNVLYFQQILEAFGGAARLIHVVRDGRDVVCSVHPDDLTRTWVAPDRWINDVQAGLMFEDHPQVLTVRFEDLVTHFDETTQRVCDFVGIDMTSQLRQFPQHATVTNSNAWFEAVRHPAADAIGKWRTTSHVDRVDELVSNRLAFELLDRLEYL